MKFLIVEPSPLPILIPPGLRVLFSNTLSLHSSLNVSQHIAQLAKLLFYSKNFKLDSKSIDNSMTQHQLRNRSSCLDANLWEDRREWSSNL